MKILLTGVTGYIGKRLLPVLLEQGHEVYEIRIVLTPRPSRQLLKLSKLTFLIRRP